MVSNPTITNAVSIRSLRSSLSPMMRTLEHLYCARITRDQFWKDPSTLRSVRFLFLPLRSAHTRHILFPPARYRYASGSVRSAPHSQVFQITFALFQVPLPARWHL
jgi:hypothetical protein